MVMASRGSPVGDVVVDDERRAARQHGIGSGTEVGDDQSAQLVLGEPSGDLRVPR